jgi:hypothetical protein
MLQSRQKKRLAISEICRYTAGLVKNGRKPTSIEKLYSLDNTPVFCREFASIMGDHPHKPEDRK